MINYGHGFPGQLLESHWKSMIIYRYSFYAYSRGYCWKNFCNSIGNHTLDMLPNMTLSQIRITIMIALNKLKL